MYVPSGKTEIAQSTHEWRNTSSKDCISLKSSLLSLAATKPHSFSPSLSSNCWTYSLTPPIILHLLVFSRILQLWALTPQKMTAASFVWRCLPARALQAKFNQMPSQGFRICRVRHRAAAQELLHEKKSLLGFNREACLFQIGRFFCCWKFPNAGGGIIFQISVSAF